MAINNMTERNNIVNWFENDFKNYARMTTKTQKTADGRVNYSFSVTNDSGYGFAEFKFDIRIKSKHDGSEIGVATINAGRWEEGESKTFRSNFSLPVGVTSISFVMYSESVQYTLLMTAADLVTTATNEIAGTYAQRRNEKQLNKLRLGKSTMSKVMFVLAVLFALAAMGSVGETYYVIMYGAVAMLCLGVGFIARGVKGFEGQRIRAYESAINYKGNTSIYDLAAVAGRKDTSKAIDDLQQMITHGFFEEAYIDRENMLLVMTENGNPLQSIEESVAENKKSRRKAARLNGLAPESISDLILMTDDEEIKEKLKTLEKMTDKIDERVEEKPELEKQVKEFRDKYFPEVVRLTDNYNLKIAKLENGYTRESKQDFDVEPDALAEQAKDIKAQLNKLIDHVIEATDNLIEKLYEDDIMDINTDIQSLQTTLASRGLLDSDFDITL